MTSNRLRSFKDLLVWQRAMELAREVYLLTRGFPQAEAYGLTAQLRRSAVSIPSAIAEGNGRRYTRDYQRYLLVARGSHQEVETQLLLARSLDFASSEDTQRVLAINAEVGRMLAGLSRALRRHVAP